jgi:hypothetical protein
MGCWKGETMPATNTKRRRLLAVFPLSLLALPVAGCIFVAEDVCFEGDRFCDDEYVVECIYNEWVMIENWYYACQCGRRLPVWMAAATVDEVARHASKERSHV